MTKDEILEFIDKNFPDSPEEQEKVEKVDDSWNWEYEKGPNEKSQSYWHA